MKIELMSIVQVAKILNLKPSTVAHLARAGKIPYLKIGKAMRFRCEDIQNLIDKNIIKGGDHGI